jgi:hypothetical protein
MHQHTPNVHNYAYAYLTNHTATLALAVSFGCVLLFVYDVSYKPKHAESNNNEDVITGSSSYFVVYYTASEHVHIGAHSVCSVLQLESSRTRLPASACLCSAH